MIRPATMEDIDAIAKFQTTTWNEAYEGMAAPEYLSRMTVETRAARWGERLRAGDRQIWIEQRLREILGIVSFGVRADTRPGPQLELMSLYVSRTARGTGVGTRLLELAVGDSAAVLWVFEVNARAILFYEHHGFAVDEYRSLDPDTAMPLIRMIRSTQHRRGDT